MSLVFPLSLDPLWPPEALSFTPSLFLCALLGFLEEHTSENKFFYYSLAALPGCSQAWLYRNPNGHSQGKCHL
jgi:hypothetical protein